MECYAKRPVFITLNDHKENFKTNQKCRLINPSKSEMGIVSKKYLENIISKLNCNLRYSQWRNTSTVIDGLKLSKIKRNKDSSNSVSLILILRFQLSYLTDQLAP